MAGGAKVADCVHEETGEQSFAELESVPGRTVRLFTLGGTTEDVDDIVSASEAFRVSGDVVGKIIETKVNNEGFLTRLLGGA